MTRLWRLSASRIDWSADPMRSRLMRRRGCGAELVQGAVSPRDAFGAPFSTRLGTTGSHGAAARGEPRGLLLNQWPFVSRLLISALERQVDARSLLTAHQRRRLADCRR